MKPKKEYTCTNCDYISTKWLGKCPNCGAWNSFQETVSTKTVTNQSSLITNQVASFADILESLDKNEVTFFPYASPALNQFFNQGLVKSCLTLLAGEPGLGKSTLSLQLLRSLVQGNPKLKCLYVSAEESNIEVAKRAKRLQIPDSILLLQTNLYETIEQAIYKHEPDVVIVDSIQTIFTVSITSNVGSTAQVAQVSNNFLALSKNSKTSIILIGHVTKDGQIAGPKTLEHIVDSVLSLEISPNNLRTLSFTKHRYGSTDQQLVLKMTENGLEIITDPSLEMLGNFEEGVGICYALAMEKNVPLLVEIQSLVSPETQGFGRREVQGISVSRVNIVLAILHKYLHIDLSKNDIYVQVLGSLAKPTDFNLDLAILLAIYSSFKNQPISKILDLSTSEKSAFAGRLTLSGNLRQPASNENRQKIAKKLKLSYNPKIEFGNLLQIFVKNS